LIAQPSRPDVFIAENFIEAHVCSELKAAAKQSSAAPAQVTKSTGRVDLDMRRTSRLFLPAEKEVQITSYLQKLKPQLETYFDLELKGFENFQFLLYREGDFYKRHADKNDRVESPDYIKARQISVVIFLNHETLSDDPDGYEGGTLVIWSHGEALRVQGETGKVIAFPSNLMHQVEAVKARERYSLVSWYF
jgi:predicted 2-oxoglutarate/Fe(II)-dependent dioxygenase YbiX